MAKDFHDGGKKWLLFFEVEVHNFEFTKHVSDEQHPSSVANTNEPLVGVV